MCSLDLESQHHPGLTGTPSAVDNALTDNRSLSAALSSRGQSVHTLIREAEQKTRLAAPRRTAAFSGSEMRTTGRLASAGCVSINSMPAGAGQREVQQDQTGHLAQLGGDDRGVAATASTPRTWRSELGSSSISESPRC